MNYSGADGLEFGAGNTRVDPAVLAELPRGCTVTSTEEHGDSFWAKTGRIDVSLPDGTHESFFIKVVSKEVGLNMTKGEFASMSAAYEVTLEFVPRPIACGTYTTIPDTHFFLCEFRHMTGAIPESGPLVSPLSKLYKLGDSPTGKFGFPVTTYPGNLPQYVGWEDSWETFFAKSMKQALDFEIKRRGARQRTGRAIVCFV